MLRDEHEGLVGELGQMEVRRTYNARGMVAIWWGCLRARGRVEKADGSGHQGDCGADERFVEYVGGA